MVECPKCKKQNPDDAKFCNSCGEQLTVKEGFEKNVDNFTEELEHIGKKIEEKGKNIDTWYNTTFGPISPLISSIVGIIIFFIVIKILLFLGNSVNWLGEIGVFFETYMYWFFVYIVFSAYTSYLSKKYQKFRWISPIVGAISFVFSFWVILKILGIIGSSLGIGFLTSFSNFFENVIVLIGVLVLLVGYSGLFISKKTCKHIEKNVKEDDKTSEKQDGPLPYKRLYRSGNERILGGVCGGLGEYLKIDPVIVRIIFVIGFFAFLSALLAYIILWIVVPRNPNHKWNN